MARKNGKKSNGNTPVASASAASDNTVTQKDAKAAAAISSPTRSTSTNNTAKVKVTTTVSSNSNSSSDNTDMIHFYDIMFYFIISFALVTALYSAYTIRMHAIREYGLVIHEFDPYFNLRATEYLYHNGIKNFFTWFDHKSWYPLGRPVGTTIYPGMQFTAVFIKNYIVGDSMSLNDVCCLIPAWFGVLASIFTGLVTYECSLECNTQNHIMQVLWNLVAPKDQQLESRKMSGSGVNDKERRMKWRTALVCGVIATMIMAIVPAHLMRSIGGGYDNESIAMTTMMMTFYFWVRSLRSGETYSFLYGILTGISYFYMVATWGGYVFVLNMIGMHATILVALGRFTTKVYLSYSLFYVIGTALAIQIPVVGLTPLKSLEQFGCCLIFIGYQILFICERMVKKRKLSGMAAWKFRIQLLLAAAVTGAIFASLFLPQNYFGPISSRVRGLFVKHTKTGNPLVDSVAEHQPAKPNAYYQYLHQLCTFTPLGFTIVFVYFGDSPSFLCAYAVAAYFFSLKMVRLVLLMGPVSSILSGIAAGRILVWSFTQMFKDDTTEKVVVATTPPNSPKKKKLKKGKKQVTNDDNFSFSDDKVDINSDSMGSWMKRLISFVLVLTIYFSASAFRSYSWSISSHLSSPSIIQKAQKRDGTIVYIDDYREAYTWVRDNTPEDSRIMAWWDYGYQIASIANRTTIADGNTWNHEHIALLGKIYTTDVNEGYSIARHLADYILVWAGGGGDDLAKSPHLARIANSVYRDLCPGDPVCSGFGLVRPPKGKEKYALSNGMMPSAMMQASLVNHLVSDGQRGVRVDPTQFKEVFRSKYAKVRVYKILEADQSSKAWAADPENRICDAPGSWFCRGQYPPALQEVLQKGKTFVQLEDFNKKEEDSEYQKLYMDSLNKNRKQRDEKMNEKVKRQKKQTVKSDL